MPIHYVSKIFLGRALGNEILHYLRRLVTGGVIIPTLKSLFTPTTSVAVGTSALWSTLACVSEVMESTGTSRRAVSSMPSLWVLTSANIEFGNTVVCSELDAINCCEYPNVALSLYSTVCCLCLNCGHTEFHLGDLFTHTIPTILKIVSILFLECLLVLVGSVEIL